MKKLFSTLVLFAALVATSCSNDSTGGDPETGLSNYTNTFGENIELSTFTNYYADSFSKVYTGKDANSGYDFNGTLFMTNDGTAKYTSQYGSASASWSGFAISQNFATDVTTASNEGSYTSAYDLFVDASSDYDNDGTFVVCYYSSFQSPNTSSIYFSEPQSLASIAVANSAATASYKVRSEGSYWDGSQMVTYPISDYSCAVTFTAIDSWGYPVNGIAAVTIELYDSSFDAEFTGWKTADLSAFTNVEGVEVSVDYTDDSYTPTFVCLDALTYAVEE